MSSMVSYGELIPECLRSGKQYIIENSTDEHCYSLGITHSKITKIR